MSGISLFPAILLDILGSAAMSVFALLALRYARLLSKRQPNNFVWGYLYYVTFAIAAFAISRAVGHLVKQFLLIAGREDIWSDDLTLFRRVQYLVHHLGGGRDDLLS